MEIYNQIFEKSKQYDCALGHVTIRNEELNEITKKFNAKVKEIEQNYIKKNDVIYRVKTEIKKHKDWADRKLLTHLILSKLKLKNE